MKRRAIPWFHPGDAVAGVTVALVLIPQALAYATLAGVPAGRGLFAAALAPLAAALFASSPYLATGPTALTSLLTFGALSTIALPGGPEYVLLAALLALLVGVVRIVMGLVHAGPVAYLMSQPVMLGFTAGAAVVIVASQVPAIVGRAAAGGNPLRAALEVLRDPGSWQLEAILIGIATALVMVGGRRVHRLFPGILAAVALALAFNAVVGYEGAVLGEIESGLPPITLALPWRSLSELIAPALVIALIGFAEPASVARRYSIIDRLRWNPNRELISQGAANLISGVGGGFPVGGSLSRTALARTAGARTRVAGAVTGLVVVLFLPFVSILETLPSAVLAAAIIVAVSDLVQVPLFLDYFRYARLQFAVALATFVLTIVFAPHVERAVLIGILLAILAHLWRELRLSIPAWREGDALHLAPKGVLYFASAPGLAEAFGNLLAEHPSAHRLIVHLGGLGRVDLTGALVLRGIFADAKEAGFEVEVVDVPPQARKIIGRVVQNDA
ncbi:MAG: SulP family inorganic anion transporter [Actinomycetota bacterium]|nr:SulP family inorganic anion transporter [Actinomycetota bacterium]